MAKREQAQEEAKFARGEIGVDGQATAEQLDDVEVERQKAREQFLRGKAWLGREFLTWLLWRTEAGDPLLKHEGESLTVVFADRLVLKGIAGEIVEMAVKGATAPYSPLVRRAVSRGLLVHVARLRLTLGERVYEVTLDAEFLDFKGAKLPDLLSEDEDDGIQERIDLSEQLMLLVHTLLTGFLKLRQSKKWLAETVPAMRDWMTAES